MYTINSFTSVLILFILLLMAAIIVQAMWMGKANDRAYQAGLGERALKEYPRPQLVPAPMPAPVEPGRDGGDSHGIRTMVNGRGDRRVARGPGKPPYGARMDRPERLAIGAHSSGEKIAAGDGVSTFQRTRISRHGRVA